MLLYYFGGAERLAAVRGLVGAMREAKVPAFVLSNNAGIKDRKGMIAQLAACIGIPPQNLCVPPPPPAAARRRRRPPLAARHPPPAARRPPRLCAGANSQQQHADRRWFFAGVPQVLQRGWR